MSSQTTGASTTTELAHEPKRAAAERTLSTTTELARERNRGAAERTLMALIRTAISMISFGIGFGAAGNYLGKSASDPARIHDLEWVGSALILLGVVSLFAAIIQNIRLVKRIKNTDFAYLEPIPIGVITAILLLIFGLFGFVWIQLS